MQERFLRLFGLFHGEPDVGFGRQDAERARAVDLGFGAADGGSGFVVTVAANGRAALEQLQSGDRPRLILLDLMMPEMNGWEFLERARQDESLGSIPIVVMTAHKSTDLPRVAPEDVLHKPFNATTLLATIARHMT